MSLRLLGGTVALIGIAVSAACSDPAVAPETDALTNLTSVEARPANGHGKAHSSKDVHAWMMAVRDRTRAYRDYDAAATGGYVAELSPCVDDADGKGMGYHIGNPALIDTQLDPLQPEILLYEPQANGKRRLVGVEYIVPLAAWSGSEPPQVGGQSLLRNDHLGLWALHFWTERPNPDGVFQNYNPLVSCRYAPERAG